MNDKRFAARHRELVAVPALAGANPARPRAGPSLHRAVAGQASVRPGQPPRLACSEKRDRAAPALFTRMLDRLSAWRWRRSALRELDTLDDHLLRDIGLTREKLAEERNQFFWQA